jgi:hypothetical protein
MTNISLDALAAAADRGRRKHFRDLKLTEPPSVDLYVSLPADWTWQKGVP